MFRLARRWLLGFGAACALGVAARGAQAQAEPVRIGYRSFAGCPDQSVFFAGLAARTPRVRAAEADEPARSVDVAIVWRGSVAQGLLVVSAADGSSTRREVTGNDCAEVVSALALVAALVIDPRAASGPVAPPASAPEAAPPAPPPAVPRPAAKPTSAAPAVASRSIPARDRVQYPTAMAPSQPGHEQLLVGAAALGISGPVPDPAFGGGAFVGLDDARRRVLALSGRVSVFAVTVSETFPGDVGARFTWVLLRPELCPVRTVWIEPLRLELCGFFDVGLLDTQGQRLDQNQHSSRLWLAPGASARASLELARGLLVEVSGGVEVPVRRYPFAYDPDGNGGVVEVHEVRFVAETLSVGLGYRFP